jgi:hypothetical protein
MSLIRSTGICKTSTPTFTSPSKIGDAMNDAKALYEGSYAPKSTSCTKSGAFETLAASKARAKFVSR